MTEYQPNYHSRQRFPDQEVLIMDPLERQSSVNSQYHSSQHQSERARSSSRRPLHIYTPNLHNTSPSESSVHSTISLSSEESPSERRSRKRAATVAPPNHHSSKRVRRAGSVFSHGHSPRINAAEYRNRVQMRDNNMHGLNSPIEYQNGVSMLGNLPPRIPGNVRQQNGHINDPLIQEFQRQRSGLLTEATQILQGQLGYRKAEERRLKREMGQNSSGSHRNSVSNGSHGSINGTGLSSPSSNGHNASLLGMLGANPQSPIANGSHASMHSPNPPINAQAHLPNTAFGFGSPTLSLAGQQNGFQRQEIASSPGIRLDPGIWDTARSSEPHPVDVLRERTRQATQGPKRSDAPQRPSRAQSVAPRAIGIAYDRGRSIGPAVHQSNAGGGGPPPPVRKIRKVNKLTGDWADPSDDDESLPPPERFQRPNIVAPSSHSSAFNQFSNGAHVQGMNGQTFQRGQGVAPETHAQDGNHMINGIHSQTPQGRVFRWDQTEALETPRNNIQNKQHDSNSTNFATSSQYPQPSNGQFDFFNPPDGRSPNPHPGLVQHQHGMNDPLPPPPPTPGSDNGSMRELMQNAKFQARHGMTPAQQYVNDVPKRGMKFRARKKNPPPPITPNRQAQIIDLISPDGSEIRLQPFPMPPIVEKPMKERIAPASKPGARKPGKSIAPDDDPRTYEQKRQERAAKIIAEQERKGAEREIFGEEIQSIDEAKKKVQEERERLENRKRARERQEANKKESIEVAALRALLVQKEKAEQEELRKQLEESRNKLRREGVRKVTEHEEAEAREERREAAASKIEADRKKAEAAKLEREKKRRMENEVQVQAKALEQSKARQEALKKQVANIKASKVSSDGTDSSLVCLGEKTISEAEKTAQNAGTRGAGNSAETSKGKEKGTANTNANARFRKDVVDLESGIFVPENVPPSQDGTEINTTALGKDKQPLVYDRAVLNNLYDSDTRRIRGKSIGPTTAAELCAIVQAQEGKRTQSHREVRDNEIESRRIQERLQSRLARREREKSAPPPAATSRPEPKAARPSPSQKEPRQPVRPRATKASGKLIDKELTSAIFPKFMPDAPTRPAANKILATISKEPAAPIISKPTQGVVLISDEERARIDAEQKQKAQLEREKQAAAKAEQKRQQVLEHQKRARERATIKAREKQRLKLIEDAKGSGVELSQMELLSKLEDFMSKREKRKAKTAATRARHDQIKNFGADDLATAQEKASQAAAACQANNNIDLEDDPNDDSPAARELRAKRESMRETLHAMSQNRRSQQSQPTRMTCANESDTDSSIESEEDPDPDSSSSGDSSDDDEASQSSHTLSGKGNSSLENSQIVTQIERPLGLTPGPKNGRRRAPRRPPVDFVPDNCVSVYSVEEIIVKDGIEQPLYTRNIYLNLEDAENEAKQIVKEYSKSKPYNYNEWYTRDDGGIPMFNVACEFDEEGENQMHIWIGKSFKSKDMNPVDFGMAEINKLRFAEKCYIVQRTVTRKKIDPVDGTIKEKQKVDLLGNWTDIDLANEDAVKEFIGYIKPPIDLDNPKPGDTDRLERYDNRFCPEVRKARNDLAYGECFDVELEKDELVEGSVDWLDEAIVHVRFMVRPYSMMGPLN